MAETISTIDKQEEVNEPNIDDDLPQKILEKYSSDQQVQLIKGYRILQVLMYYENNSPFFEKPENELFNTRYYYDVIKNPMWCFEIKRKLFNAEYNSLVGVIKDMRLIFENCYYFWGPKTTMSEQCVKMERLMEKQLLMLTKDLKTACSLEETHGKNEDETVTKIWNRLRNKGKGCSNLMLRTWRKRRMDENEEYKKKSDLAKFCDCGEEIFKWEKDFLQVTDHYDSICSVIQLPQIGQFFHLVHNVLRMKPFCQTEIEFMFLMPQYSESFRRILSILLDETIEEMIYDDLIDKLGTIIAKWYEVYDEKNGDDIEASRAVGIEPEFFRIVGESNPLLINSYEELPYRKKVVMIKSLCDHLVHKKSDVKDVIINADEKVFTPRTVGRDKLGYGYLFFDTFLDFRLYKQKEDEASSNAEYFQGFDDEKTTFKRFFSKCSTNFEKIADSIEGLRSLIDELIYSDVEGSKKDTKSTNHEIIESLRELENKVISNQERYIKRTNQVRIKMYRQWKKAYMKENPTFFKENNSDEVNTERNKQIENGDYEDANDVAEGQTDNLDDSGEKNEDEKENYDTCTENAETNEIVVKTEIKEELHTDDSLSSETTTSSTRRRRSSVPTYKFDNDLFFNSEGESDSPEEVYTEGTDSDEDWNVPKKRCKKTKNKLPKQLKQNAAENRKRKTSIVLKRENFVKIENVTSIAQLPETEIKQEMNIEKDISFKPSEERQKEEDKKGGLKIKVVDLAKLTKSDDFQTAGGSTSVPSVMNPIMNNKMGVARGNASTFSNVRPTFTIVGQPQVISNAYIITTNPGPMQSTPSRGQVRQYSGPVYGAPNFALAQTSQTGNRIPGVLSGGRIISPNNKLVFVNQNSPIQFSSPVGGKPIVRASSSVTRPVRYPQSAMIRNVPRPNVNIGVAPKFGRSVTMIPKTNKIIDKRNLVREIEGSIGIHSNNGTMQYVVNLANGTHVPLTNEQVQKLREGNNGALPLKLKIPVPSDVAEKIEPCVIIDD